MPLVFKRNNIDIVHKTIFELKQTDRNKFLKIFKILVGCNTFLIFITTMEISQLFALTNHQINTLITA